MINCLFCGVGGQGIVLASRIIAAAAIECGMSARTAETIGMAQRGGSVVSHVRIGKNVYSSLIPYGEADIIIGFEPGEVVRNLHYLKKNGVVITCKKEVQPVTASLNGDSYSGDEMIAYIKAKGVKCHIIDSEAICRQCSSQKVVNVAMVGAAIESGILCISFEDIERVLKMKVKPQFLEINMQALKLGAEMIRNEA